MTTTFTRTPAGLAEKWRFHNVPTVWVEGPTDIYFYEPMLDGLAFRLEAFHGVENSAALVDSLKRYNYPYLVVIDGDYRILSRTRSPHPRVLFLSRYSFENYLWECDAVNKACLRHARCGDDKDLVVSEMAAVENHLKTELGEVVALDVAARMTDPSPAVLPDHIDALLRSQKGVSVESARVGAIVAAARASIDAATTRRASASIKHFLTKRPFMHLLKGHLVLGVLRRIFVNAAAKESGANSQVSNDALTQLLAEKVWRRNKSPDHVSLRRRLREKLSKLAPDYPNAIRR